MKQIRSKLSDKKEKKLSYDYMYIEGLTEEFLAKYNIDGEMEIFIQGLIDEHIDLDLAYKNVMSNKPYKSQIEVSFFTQIKEYLEKLLLDSIEAELKTIDDEEKKAVHKEILYNTMETIKLTMFEDGIKRSTLTAYHYFLKVLHINTFAFMEANGYKKIKGIKNSNELLAKEIYLVIGQDKELIRFVVTLKNLIEQWLIKYNNKTKIGDFYYDILMITPEFIIEKILKYLTMVAIKNKNPMTLRAIFSSYITLIHKNLFSYYAANLSKVRVGYFKQLEKLFTENFDLIHDRDDEVDTKTLLIDTMMKTFLMKNKRYIKDDFELINNEYFQYFFEVNYNDALDKYQYDSQMNILDHMYFYNTVLKYTENKHSKLPENIRNTYVINQQFIKRSNKKKNLLYIKEKLNRKLFSVFYNIFGEAESVDTIIESMAKDITKRVNFEIYLDKDTLTPVNMNFGEYMTSIDTFINNTEKIIIHEGRLGSVPEESQDILHQASLEIIEDIFGEEITEKVKNE